MALSSPETYVKLKGETLELLNDVGQSLASLLDAPAADGHAEAHIDLTQQLGSFFGSYYKLRKRLERDALSVAVLALTKSGKSTLINAFLANEVLPVNNVPETARICRIRHVPSASCPEPVLELTPLDIGASRSNSLASAGSASYDSSSPGTSPMHGATHGSNRSSLEQPAVEVLTGAGAIREHLQQLNRDVRAREHMRNDEKVLNISAPLVVLDNPGSSAAGASGSSSDLSAIQLCLLDTPGPNEAGEEGLKYQVERLLGRVDAVIYLLDYTKLKTAEEAGVLSRLKAINPALVKRLCSRLFFAVNKMDQADESCGLDEEETREYVAEIITQQLNCPEFKLHPDQVLLLSARDALLSRLILTNRSDPANTQRFCRVAFGAYNPKPRGGARGSSSGGLPGAAGRSAEELSAAAEGLLGGSGVPELEERVLGFLVEAAGGVKLMATLDDTGRLLTEVSNVSCSCRAALAASSSALVDKTAALQAQLDDTLGQFDAIMGGTQELQVEVTDELRAHLGNLRSRLFTYIINALDADGLLPQQQQQQGPAPGDDDDDDHADDSGAGAEEAAAADEAAGGGSDDRRHHHRRRRHGCCASRHRRRHGASSSSGAGGSSSYFFATDAGAAGGSYSSTAAMYGAAHLFNCVPGAYPTPSGCPNPFFSTASSSSRGGSRRVPVNVPLPAAGAGGGEVSGVGGWWGLRQRFLALFGRGGGAGGTTSKDELSSALMDLSEDIMGQIQAEVAEAWHVMEASTNERAARLTASLNAHLQTLSAQLEGAVNEALQIQLEPVSLRLAAPDAVTFHADLTDLIEKGIRHQQTRHVRTGERTDYVTEERRGACRLTSYYVSVPRRRRIIETYTATTYSLAPEGVLDHFMGVVDEAISATETHLPAYVREYVRRQVDEARDKVQAYGSRYIDSLSAALEAASQGAEARQAALAQVSTYCDAFDALRTRLAALQAKAELLVPHNSTSGCGLFEQVDYEEQEQEEVSGPQEQEATAAAQAEVSGGAGAAAAGGVEAGAVPGGEGPSEVAAAGSSRGVAGVVAAAAAAAGATAAAVTALSQPAASGTEGAASGGVEGPPVPQEPSGTEGAASGGVEGPPVPQEPALLDELLLGHGPSDTVTAAEPEVHAEQEAAAAADVVAGVAGGDESSAAPQLSAADVLGAAEVDLLQAAPEAAARAEPAAAGAGGAGAGTGSTVGAAAAASSNSSSSFFGAGLSDLLASWMMQPGSSSSTTASTAAGAAAAAAVVAAGAGAAAAELAAASSQQQQQQVLQAGDVEGAALAAQDDDSSSGSTSNDECDEEAEAARRIADSLIGRAELALGDDDDEEEEEDVDSDDSAAPDLLDEQSDDDSAVPELLDDEVVPGGEGPAAAATAAAAARMPDLGAAAVAPDHDGHDDDGAPRSLLVDSELPELLDAEGGDALGPYQVLGRAGRRAATDAPAAVVVAVAEQPAEPAGSSGSSAVSDAETAVSDSFSLMSGAATDGSAFSGMTAGTAFTLQSSSSSGLSKAQDLLASGVLAGAAWAPAAAAAAAAAAAEPSAESAACPPDATAAAAPADAVGAAAAAAPPAAVGEQELGMGSAAAAPVAEAVAAPDAMTDTTDTEPQPAGAQSLYASMYGSGLLLSADDIQGALQMNALPDAATTPAQGADPHAASSGSSGGSFDVNSDPHPAASVPASGEDAAAAAATGGGGNGSGSSAAAVEAWQGDASLYASIIAHSEDHEQPGSPFNFGESFAAALSAAGLDGVGGPSPPSGSPRDSEDWQMVEPEEGPGQGEAGPDAGQQQQAQEGTKAGRSWLGRRG